MPKAKPAPSVTPPPEAAETLLLPLADLYLHPVNPRQEPPEAEIAALADSIRALGLLQNLSGFDDTGSKPAPGAIGIVAGGRRLRALQLLAAQGHWSDPVPVRVTADPDLAAQWAGAENETQRGLSIPDRIAAYARMRAAGHATDAIAAAFATPVTDVRRLLALATLPEAALDALRAEKISFAVAKALTSARDAAAQDAALRAALDGSPDWQVKDMLRQGSVTTRDRRAKFVGLDAYHAAGGSSTLDLFEGESVLHDAALLQQMAQEKGDAAVQAVRDAEGWSWAVFTLDSHWQVTDGMRRVSGQPVPLPEADAARLAELEAMDADTLPEDEARALAEELDALEDRAAICAFSDADRASAGIVAHLAAEGELVIDRAWRRKGDRDSSAGGDDSIDVGPVVPEAAMPQNLKDDLRRIRLIVLQDTLRQDEVLAHDLLALQLARKLRAWEAPFALDQTHAILPSRTEGLTVPKALADPRPDDDTAAEADPLASWFRQDEDTISRALFEGLARAFCRTEGPVVDHIAARAQLCGRPINARKLWTPNAANFFGRVGAGYLDAVWRDLVPDEGSRHDGFASLSKKDKARELDRLFSDWSLREALGLSRDENTRIDAWLPQELRFDVVAGIEGEE